MELYRKTLNFGPGKDEIELYKRLIAVAGERGFNRLVKRVLREHLSTLEQRSKSS